MFNINEHSCEITDVMINDTSAKDFSVKFSSAD